MSNEQDMDPKDKEFLEALGSNSDNNMEDSERLYNVHEILSIRCAEYYSSLKDETSKQKYKMSSDLISDLVMDYQNRMLDRLNELSEEDESNQK